MAQENTNSAPIPAPVPLPTNEHQIDEPVAPPIIDLSSPKKQKQLKTHLDELDQQKQAYNDPINRNRETMRQYLNEMGIETIVVPKPWELQPAPFKKLKDLNGLNAITIWSNCVQISRNEFVVAPSANDTNKDIKNNGLCKYNIDTKEWQILIAYPDNFIAEYHTIGYDDINKIIYLSAALTGIFKFYLNTKKVEFIGSSQYLSTALMEKGSGGKIFCINGELQYFLGYKNNRHLFWAQDTKTFEVFKEFKDFPEGLIGFGMVYNQRENELLFMGGFKGKGRGRTDEIWRFSMDTKKTSNGQILGWQKVENVTMPDKMQTFACVITSDCKNILIFGGSDSNGFNQKIKILNLETMTWRESKIKMPFKTVKDGNVVLMRRESENLLVKGYMRRKEEEFKLKGWVLDLNEIIFDFYVNEEVHIFASALYHAKISLVEILEE